MPAPPVISDLVERFEQQGDAYKSGQYNEAQLRKEFIDPMFKALGWDMENVSGYAEAYKDVIHEDAIKIGGATKAPDYCFRIGGTRKFFLEAKKPSVDIKTDAQPAYQLRRYAWSAKLPLSILTDFEEFAVYDCRIEPKLSDKASVARVLYLNFCEYVPEWEESPRSSRAKRFSKAPSISLPNRRRRSVARLRWMTHSSARSKNGGLILRATWHCEIPRSRNAILTLPFSGRSTGSCSCASARIAALKCTDDCKHC